MSTIEYDSVNLNRQTAVPGLTREKGTWCAGNEEVHGTRVECWGGMLVES
jgi:hypothetical protein